MTKASNWKQKFIHTVWEVICLQFEFCIKEEVTKLSSIAGALLNNKIITGLYCNVSTAELSPPCRSQLPVSHSHLMSERASAQHPTIPSLCTWQVQKAQGNLCCSKEGWKPAGARIGGCKKSRGIFVSVCRFGIMKRLLLVQNLSHNSCYLSFLWGDLCYVCGLAAAFCCRLILVSFAKALR
jgi:hypothetical protein